MQTNDHKSLTDKNLDRLADFLNRELARPSLAEQIPDGAHIFHGSYGDTVLTQMNLKLAGKILLGMTLGYIEEAPLIMVFEYQPGKQAVVDLSTEIQKEKVNEFIAAFQEQSQQFMTGRIKTLLAA